jgi:uncharacterized protein YecE (DUF72 family)
VTLTIVPTTAATKAAPILVGSAGWALPGIARDRFPDEGSILERYASRLPAVEVNSSFYRPHRPSTYARWADSVPAAFRFSVKMPKAITHEARLIGTAALLDAFIGEVSALGPRLGCLLVQLPPSLVFDAAIAEAFFGALRDRYAGMVVFEPRHPTWFTADAERPLVAHHVARVAADPAISLEAGEPGGWPGVVYYRLHGSPRVYYSAYDKSYLDRLSARLRAHAHAGTTTFCIFDNTALGEAALNALDVHAAVGS